MYLSTDQAHMMARIKDVGDLPTSRPVLNPLADIVAQGSPITAIVGDTTIDIVRPLENSLCKKNLVVLTTGLAKQWIFCRFP